MLLSVTKSKDPIILENILIYCCGLWLLLYKNWGVHFCLLDTRWVCNTGNAILAKDNRNRFVCIYHCWVLLKRTNFIVSIVIIILNNSVISGKESCIKYVRKIFCKTNISCPRIRTRTCQGLRNVCFSENFGHVINKWSPMLALSFLFFICYLTCPRPTLNHY